MIYPPSVNDYQKLNNNPSVNNPIFQKELIRCIPEELRDTVKDAFARGLPVAKGFYRATGGPNVGDEMLNLLSKTKVWLEEGVTDPNCAIIRKDGLVVPFKAENEMMNFVRCYLGGNDPETVSEDFWRQWVVIPRTVYSVNRAIEQVTTPTPEQKVAAFEFLRKRSERL